MKKERFVLGWAGGENESPLVRKVLSDRVRSVVDSHHGMWNYMTFRDAIGILGLDPAEVYREGRIDLDPEEWADFGWMTCYAGPPESAVKAMRERTVAQNINPYSPDLITPLRNACAEVKFGRERGADFEVIGTEGSQAAISYALQTVINPGDEVIITDPGYFHFESSILMAGGRPVRIPLGKGNGYRLDPSEVEARITPRTKVLIVCDPLNPFGTVQTRDELIALTEITASRGIIVINDITHDTQQIDPETRHYPMTALYKDTNTDNVLCTFSLSHGYGMAGVRIGFLAGSTELMRACLITKTSLTRLNTNLIAQYGALAALEDRAYVKRSQEIIRRNFALVKEIVAGTDGVSIPVEPRYGFSMVIDVSGTGVTAQELTVSLFKRRVAVYPGDGLGDVGAERFVRLNISRPDLRAFSKLREALPEAIAEARNGVYKGALIDFFSRRKTARAKTILERIKGGS